MHHRPDLEPLYKTSEPAGRVLKKGDMRIYESTVYPGVTEEVCMPVLKKISGLQYDLDLFAGYSPDRINPGDKDIRSLNKKITSDSTPGPVFHSLPHCKHR